MNRRVWRRLSVVGTLALFLLAIAGNVFAAAHDNDIWWAQLGHDSRDTLYRYPGGAVPTGTAVTLRFRAANGDLTSAEVRIWNDREDFEQFIPMSLVASGVTLPGDPEVYEFWEATLPTTALPTVYWYRFILRDGTRTVYYEDDSARTGGWGQPFDNSLDNSWQLSFYDPAYQTPDWIKNAVVYQIFPDRFRDGDPSNNPGAGEFFYGNYDTVVRSTGTDWNTLICDPRDVLNTDVCDGIYSQNFYGGDLQGIIDRLDYLAGLGVTAIYLNPIFKSPSNHRYDTIDFFEIDPRLGDLATFQTLVSEAEARSINIILDGVFNHSSSDSIYFDRYSRWDASGNPTTVGDNDGSGACESLNSPFVNWYTFFPYTGQGAAPCSDNRDYPKWFGIFDSLPVYNHDDAEVRDYFINNGTNSVGPYWMQWADGWRLDVAPEVDHGTINDPNDNYWETFRTAVHAVNPDAYIVGEEWGNATSWTLGGEWDATMNYQFSSATLSFMRDTPFTDNDFNGGSSAGPLNPLTPSGYNERLLNLQERYAPEAWYAMMNLFGSHDTNRVLFLLDDTAGSSTDTSVFYDPNYDWTPAMQRLRGAVLLQMTLPGAPTIYYGDEVGTINPPSYDGSQWQDDPYNRVPYPWLDESGTPYYAHMQTQATQDAMYGYYALLTNIRQMYPALRTGSFDPLYMDDATGVYGFGRQMDDDSSTAIVLVNSSASPQTVTLNLANYVPAGVTLSDVLNSTQVNVSLSGEVTVNLSPRSGAILVFGAFGRPDPVTDLNAMATAGQVNLSWSPVVGADSYDVYRSRLSHGGYALIGNETGTAFTDSNVQNGVLYYYKVVSRNDNNLLQGGDSNEVSATPALTIGWANLQWPPFLDEVASATNLSGDIYGQVWIDGVTSDPGPTPGLIAQVGYGNTNNVADGSWQWYGMSFNVDSGNNDEFMGNLPLTTVGVFCYTTRYSTDGGVNWFYAVNGPDESNPTCPGPFGVLTVNPAGDTTPPAAPTGLTVTDVTSASVSLGWDAHPNTDGDLFGFYVYREDTSAPGYTKIAEVPGATATSYVDTTAVAGTNYNYAVVAVDQSLNESLYSNIVNVTAEDRMVQVTFRVTVPSFTPGVFPVHIVGPFNGWDPGDPNHALTEVSPGIWEITIDILDGTNFEYKFARGSWDRVEKQANGYDEVDNRFTTIDYGTDGTQLIEITIANWRDPIVTGFTPADGAVDVPANTEVTFSWNKWMPTPPGGFTLTGPAGVVTGSYSFDEPSLTHTFTPASALQPGLYTVTIDGAASGGDTQQVAVSWTFSVAQPVDTTPPEAPTGLAVTATTSDSVDLTWDAHPNTDGDLAGFTLWRDEGSGFAPAATINDPAATSYTDSGLASGTSYDYYLTAFDTTGNASDASNTVTATTAQPTVAVTFNVTVPAGTPGTVYIAGNFGDFSGSPYPSWNPSGIALTQVNDTLWTVTLNLPEGWNFEYKFTRGDWSNVEKQANGNWDIGNRSVSVTNDGSGTLSVDNTVENWADPFVVSFSPPDGAIDLPGSTQVTFTWNQEMPADASATVTGPSGDVAGSFSYDPATYTHTFTPDAPFSGGTYTVTVSGNVDVNNEAQQVDTSWAFTVLISSPSMTCNGYDATIYVQDGVIVGGPMDGRPFRGVLRGGNFDDVIVGTNFDDRIRSSNGNDILCGFGGSDSLLGENGDDTLIGGDGDDTLIGGNGSDTLNGELGDDRLNGGHSSDTLSGGDGNDTLIGGTGEDTIDAGSGDDTVNAGHGQDVIYAGDGVDSALGSHGDDVIYGGAGDDTLRGGSGQDDLFGEDNDDTIFGNQGDDDLDGGDGTDVCNGGNNNDSSTSCERAVSIEN